MAFRTYELPEVGTITVYKRRGAKSVKLSITHDNKVRVTVPTWAPYKVGFDFARSKSSWIRSKQTPTELLKPDSHIGKAHHLVFYRESGRLKVATRISGSEVRVLLPRTMSWESPSAQAAALSACKRALKLQAESLLPKRLVSLAAAHDFTYRSVSTKHMKSRWGSCSQQQDIILNTYLMQLPWELIDYVILHELVHTSIMAHGEPFWDELGRYIPNLKAVRKIMREHRPVVLGQLI